jgi:hypothetical protein
VVTASRKSALLAPRAALVERMLEVGPKRRVLAQSPVPSKGAASPLGGRRSEQDAVRIEPALSLSPGPMGSSGGRRSSLFDPEIFPAASASFSRSTQEKSPKVRPLESAWQAPASAPAASTAIQVPLLELCLQVQKEDEERALAALLSRLGDEWKEARTDSGAAYYYNRRTRESQWLCPGNATVVRIMYMEDGASVDERRRIFAPPVTVTERQSSEAPSFTGAFEKSAGIERPALADLTPLRNSDGTALLQRGSAGGKRGSVDRRGRTLSRRSADGSEFGRPARVGAVLPVSEDADPQLWLQQRSRAAREEPKVPPLLAQQSGTVLLPSSLSPALTGEALSVLDVGASADEDQTLQAETEGSGEGEEEEQEPEREDPPYPQTQESADQGRFTVHSSDSFVPAGSSFVDADDEDDKPSDLASDTKLTEENPSEAARPAVAAGISLASRATQPTGEEQGQRRSQSSESLYCPFCGTSTGVRELAQHISACKLADMRRLRLTVEEALISYNQEHAPTEPLEALPQDSAPDGTNGDGEQQKTEQCADCGRTFAVGRLQGHARVCRSVFGEKRAAFDGRMKRVRGTPMEFSLPRQQPEEFIAISTPRKVQSSGNRDMTAPHPASGIYTPTPSASIMCCPNCNYACSQSRSDLLSHLKSCLVAKGVIAYDGRPPSPPSHSVAPKDGDAVAGEELEGTRTICPFCTTQCMRHTLSRHLLRCRALKQTRAQRALLERSDGGGAASTKGPRRHSASEADSVPCPHCGRKFSNISAPHHISICERVENRPKGWSANKGTRRKVPFL